MMEFKNDLSTSARKKTRPAQRLYVPPAQRNKKTVSGNQEGINLQNTEVKLNIDATEFKPKSEATKTNPFQNDIKCPKFLGCASNETEKESNGSTLNSMKKDILPLEVLNTHASVVPHQSLINDSSCGKECNKMETNLQNESTKTDEKSLVIMLDNIKIDPDKNDVDVEQAEMERAIVNINRKSRPLIKHVNVGKSNVLHIDVHDKGINPPVSKSKKLVKNVDEQIANWEDLFNEDDEYNGEIMEQISDYIGSKTEEVSDEEDYYGKKTVEPSDLDHVVELYDFPSTLRTQDLIQLYHDVNEDSMYIKWCDETHALLVLSTPAQAKKALQIEHDIIKSRAMLQASVVAAQVASRCDLKPAMKRPQTNMQTARRLITSHLGTRSRLTKEEQQRERDELRKAKELKRALRQNEIDAWDGHPRPSTT